MKVRALLPGDRDVSAAPSAALYLDGRLGDDDFDGTAPSPQGGSVGPKRTLNGLPASLSAGQVLAIRDNNIYGPASVPSSAPTTPALTLNGTSASKVRVVGWGADSAAVTPDEWTGEFRYAAISGSAPAASFWGPVTESLGNTFLAANGEQSDTLPSWLPFEAFPCEGRETYTPSYWNPAISNIVADVARRDYFTPMNGQSDGGYRPASTQPGFGSTNAPFAALVRDPSFELSFEAAADSATVTYYWRHPKFAEFFGDGPGPVGCLICCQGDPSNTTYWTRIESYSFADSEVSFTYVRSSTRVRVDGDMMLLGVPQALRQPGQFAYRYNGPSTPPTRWLVKGPWMNGGRRQIVRSRAFSVQGSHADIENVSLIQAYGSEIADVPGGLLALSGGSDNLTFRNVELAYLISTNGRQVDSSSGSLFGTSCLFTNVYSHSSPMSGGITFAAFPQSEIDGWYFTEIGGTAVSVNPTVFTPPHGGMVRNITGAHITTVHGNQFSLYENSANVTVDRSLATDRILPGTVQAQSSASPSQPFPSNKTIRRSIFQMQRSVSTEPETARGSGDSLRLGWGFTGGLVDQCWSPRGGRAGLMVGVSGSSNVQAQFDDGVVRRSAFDGIGVSSGRAAPTNGGAPLLFQDVLSTGSTSAGNLPSAWASPGGATVVRSDFSDLGKYSGAPRVAEWERISRALDFGTSGGYEPVDIGPEWCGIAWPAYNTGPEGPDPGAPVPLRLTRLWFNAGIQPGRVLAGVLRARPGSTLVIDPDYGDAADLLLDLGYVVALERFRAPIQFRIIETTIRSLVLATEFTMRPRF